MSVGTLLACDSRVLRGEVLRASLLGLVDVDGLIVRAALLLLVAIGARYLALLLLFVAMTITITAVVASISSTTAATIIGRLVVIVTAVRSRSGIRMGVVASTTAIAGSAVLFAAIVGCLIVALRAIAAVRLGSATSVRVATIIVLRLVSAIGSRRRIRIVRLGLWIATTISSVLSGRLVLLVTVVVFVFRIIGVVAGLARVPVTLAVSVLIVGAIIIVVVVVSGGGLAVFIIIVLIVGVLAATITSFVIVIVISIAAGILIVRLLRIVVLFAVTIVFIVVVIALIIIIIVMVVVAATAVVLILGVVVATSIRLRVIVTVRLVFVFLSVTGSAAVRGPVWLIIMVVIIVVLIVIFTVAVSFATTGSTSATGGEIIIASVLLPGRRSSGRIGCGGNWTTSSGRALFVDVLEAAFIILLTEAVAPAVLLSQLHLVVLDHVVFHFT